jgi:hypothetical protein
MELDLWVLAKISIREMADSIFPKILAAVSLFEELVHIKIMERKSSI